MPSNGLLILASVSAGLEERLRTTLNAFGNDIRGVRSSIGQARIEFPRVPGVHFARLALLDDPGRGAGRKRLLFATDFDGPWEEHADAIHAWTREPEAIWGCCEGYTGSGDFRDFLRTNEIPPGAYYIAFRGETRERCRRALGLREAFDRRLVQPEAREVFRAYPDLRDLVGWFRRIWDAARRGIESVVGTGATVVEVIGLMRRHGVRVVLNASKRINATLNRVGWIRWMNQLLGNRPVSPPHPYTQAAPKAPVNPVEPGYPLEDSVLQNQLTLVTDVRQDAVPELKAVLALIDLYGRRLSPPGSLVGISTIHTVRWALIDGERRLMMVSNYDGTWENYIDEFAEMILSGLDGLWASAPDYPLAGAQDLAALKQFLRVHQAPANVFYSDYPAASVLHLREALEAERWLGPILRRLDPTLASPEGAEYGRGEGNA